MFYLKVQDSNFRVKSVSMPACTCSPYFFGVDHIEKFTHIINIQLSDLLQRPF